LTVYTIYQVEVAYYLLLFAVCLLSVPAKMENPEDE